MESGELIRARGGNAFAIQASLGTQGDAATLWQEFDRYADRVDIIVNNAGTLGAREPFEDVTAAGIDEVFAINTRAPFFIVQHGLPRLRDAGRVINVSTSFTHGSRNPDILAYSM